MGTLRRLARRRQQAQIAVVAVLLAALLTGCGRQTATAHVTPSYADSSGQSRSDASGTSGTTPTGSGTPAPLTSTISFTATESGGYTATYTIEMGLPIHAKPNESVDGSLLGSSCGLSDQSSQGIDPQTDAAIPFSVSVDNTTKDFSLPSAGLAVTIIGPDGTDTGDSTLLDQVINGQNQCQNQFYWSSLGPSQSGTEGGFLLLGDYYSPTNPHGDQAAYSNDVVTLDPTPLTYSQSGSSSELLPWTYSNAMGAIGTLPVAPLIVGTTPSCSAVTGGSC